MTTIKGWIFKADNLSWEGWAEIWGGGRGSIPVYETKEKALAGLTPDRFEAHEVMLLVTENKKIDVDAVVADSIITEDQHIAERRLRWAEILAPQFVELMSIATTDPEVTMKIKKLNIDGLGLAVEEAMAWEGKLLNKKEE